MLVTGTINNDLNAVTIELEEIFQIQRLDSTQLVNVNVI